MDGILPGQKKVSWWERRTKIEKCLLVISGFCAVVIIYLASNLLMRFPTKESLKKDVCMTQKCIRSAASILEKIDKTVDPCDDFYKFACGNFIKNAIIPDHEVMISSVSKYSDKVSLELMSLFEEPIRENDSHSFKLVKTVYNSCMNKSKHEKETLNFLKTELKNLGGWPVLEPHWNEKVFDWKDVMYRLSKIGWIRTFFISMYIGIDLKNSSKHIFTISEPYSLIDGFKKGFNDTAVKAMYEYSVELAVLFGADRATAVSDMKDVIDFTIEFSKLLTPYEQRKNISLEYNLYTIRELQRNFTSFPWLKLINNYLAPMDMLTSDDVVNVCIPKFLEKLETFLPKVKKRILANFMFLSIIQSSVDYLPEEFEKKQLEYLRIVYGKNQVSPRWERCVGEAQILNIAVSSLHVKHFVDKNIKRKVRELTEDVRSAFLDTVKKIGWMDRKTKNHALLKAEKMGSLIAYPDEVLDDQKVEAYYQGLELDSDDFLIKIDFNLSHFFHMKYVQELRQPVIKNDWKYQAYTFDVNAYYVQSDNTIELPAAILKDHFFDPERPQYMNYGSIGEVIGHEITHGFDDRGRQYDKDGNLIDWWKPETNQTFNKKSQCFVEQYSNYTVPEIELKLNGERNLGENIADNGGIKIAYRGYMKWLERNKPELQLPGLPYTPRQLFWISAATTWCAKYKKEALKQSVLLGYHAPNYYRIIVPYMNSDHFGRDFNCPLGSSMNPKYKCRIW